MDKEKLPAYEIADILVDNFLDSTGKLQDTIDIIGEDNYNDLVSIYYKLLKTDWFTCFGWFFFKKRIKNGPALSELMKLINERQSSSLCRKEGGKPAPPSAEAGASEAGATTTS